MVAAKKYQDLTVNLKNLLNEESELPTNALNLLESEVDSIDGIVASVSGYKSI